MTTIVINDNTHHSYYAHRSMYNYQDNVLDKIIFLKIILPMLYNSFYSLSLCHEVNEVLTHNATTTI